MRCLYCGKHLALFRKLTGGGEFCSDGHRDKYQEEYNRLAVSRLLQAQARPEEAKPKKKKAEPRPAAAASASDDSGGGDHDRGDGGGAIAVETVEPEIEVVAFTTEFQKQQISPVAVTREWMPVEYEPVLSLSLPELASVPELARPALEHAAMQLRSEAGFLTFFPQPQRDGGTMIETASPLTTEAAQAFPARLVSELITQGFAEAPAITSDFLPSAVTREFEPLTTGIAALEFPRTEPVAGTTGFAPAVNELSSSGLIGLNLVSERPEDCALEFETSLAFQYLLELRPSFDAGLTLLHRDAETASDPPSVEAFMPVVNGIPTPDPEPAAVTPRKVLEVLSRMHGDGREPEPAELQPVAAAPVAAPLAAPVQPVPPADEEPPPASQTLKPLTIPALAPSPAALTAGFHAIIIGIQPRLLPYVPLPLRPKMAVGNALGPRAARNGAPRNGGARKGSADSPKNMPRSMLHLEEGGSAGTDSEAETPTLLGKLGGLFGKKQKNH
jgi:hypothetical protein